MSGMSRHGELRARKRFGLPKHAVEKLAAEAWGVGYPIKTFTGFFKKYLNDHARFYRSVVRVHKGNIFFFDHRGTLITCWTIPQKYKKQYLQRTQTKQDTPDATSST